MLSYSGVGEGERAFMMSLFTYFSRETGSFRALRRFLNYTREDRPICSAAKMRE